MSISRGGTDPQTYFTSKIGDVRHRWDSDPNAPANASDIWVKGEEVFSPPHGKRIEILALRIGIIADTRNPSDDVENRPSVYCMLTFDNDLGEGANGETAVGTSGNISGADTLTSEDAIWSAMGRIRQAGFSDSILTSSVGVPEIPFQARDNVPEEMFPLEMDHTDRLTLVVGADYPAPTTLSGGQRAVFTEFDMTIVWRYLD